MAQLNITLNQEEILQLLSVDREDAFKRLLQDSLNSILQAESTAQLGVEKYERSTERKDSRNGSRERTLKTRIGTIQLNVPRHRNVPFRTLIFDNYSRSEAALVSTMTEMVVNGVSTRKVSTVIETLCGTSYSKSTVSEVCKELDAHVKSFKNRPLTDAYPFIYVDATYFKVRGSKRIESRALMVALAYNESGCREIIGFDVYENESDDTWRSFLESLKERGLDSLQMITSDSHKGILYAISKVFPDVPWQRCQTHFSRNVLDHAPKKYQKAIHAELTELYHCTTIDEARAKKEAIYNEYNEVADKAMECLDFGFEDAMTVLALPNGYRRFLRTSNHLERVNKELKRRSNVIGIFPNVDSLIRLMGSVLIELHDKYSLEQKLNKSKKDKAALPLCKKQLRLIAIEQQKMLAA